MAKTITDEKIKLSIIVDGNPAQKELFDLEKSIRDLNTQQKELRKEKQLLEKQGLRETERYKAITASIKENTLTITANKNKMAELQKETSLTGFYYFSSLTKKYIMDAKFIKTDPERQFFTKIDGMTDRELQELHAFYLENLEKSNEKIRANVQFFAWVTIVSLVLGAIALNQLK